MSVDASSIGKTVLFSNRCRTALRDKCSFNLFALLVSADGACPFVTTKAYG